MDPVTDPVTPENAATDNERLRAAWSGLIDDRLPKQRAWLRNS